jgi:TonB family protein
MTLIAQLGQISYSTLNKKADFTYVDFFRKDGQVRDANIQAKENLDRNFNSVPVGLFSYIKRNYTPVLIQNEFEKGYVKGGAKYSVWQYFNSKKQVELVINHSTNKVMYIIPDTTAYVVLRNAEWVSSKLDIHPIPITGFHNFYSSISEVLDNKIMDCKGTGGGRVVFSFEVDTLGMMTNTTLMSGVVGHCDSSMISGFNSIEIKWIPGRLGKKSVPTKFAMGVILSPDINIPLKETEGSKLNPQVAKFLEETVIENPFLDRNVSTFVKKSAEPVGGLEAFYKWVGKNLRYPANARRMGLEGTVVIGLIVEKDGTISKVKIVKGFNNECDREALRVFSISPPWKPGTLKGIPVKQAFTFPVSFKLSEGDSRKGK